MAIKIISCLCGKVIEFDTMYDYADCQNCGRRIEDEGEELPECVEKEGDSLICTCGNTPHNDGFYGCDSHGNMVEPVEGKWDNLYACYRCGRIINHDTLEIVGRKIED